MSQTQLSKPPRLGHSGHAAGYSSQVPYQSRFGMNHQIFQSIARGLLVALALLLAACGVAPSAATPTLGPLVRDTPVPAPTQSAPPSATPAPAATAASATDAPAPPTAAPTIAATASAGDASVLISYHKSGGIAGVDETLTVYANGSIVLQDRTGEARAQASPADIQALQKLIASPELAALSPSQPPPAADAFVYELSIPGRAQPLVATDGAERPPLLDQLIGELESLKAQVK